MAACKVTFSPFMATETIPAAGITQANLYWVSDQAFGLLFNQRLVAMPWIAPTNDPTRGIVAGNLYLRFWTC